MKCDTEEEFEQLWETNVVKYSRVLLLCSFVVVFMQRMFVLHSYGVCIDGAHFRLYQIGIEIFYLLLLVYFGVFSSIFFYIKFSNNLVLFYVYR